MALPLAHSLVNRRGGGREVEYDDEECVILNKTKIAVKRINRGVHRTTKESALAVARNRKVTEGSLDLDATDTP